MNRPPQPHTMQNNMYRSPRPYNYKWRPNRAPVAPFPWRTNTPFRVFDKRTENNEEHWCETCDRGFPTADLLHKHNQQHQKCNIDGCQFVAHPKVITKHIQMQHSSGLYKKIANLNNPEEIQKWREERKKKYPTKANIEKKAAECEEKIKRGEKMGLKHDYRNDMKYKSTDQRPGNKRKHEFDNKNHNHKTPKQNLKHISQNSTNNNKPSAKKIPKALPCTPSTVDKNKLKPFTGILNVYMDDEEDTAETFDCSNGLIEDVDEELLEHPKDILNNQEPILCGALTSLMCDYGTSDEETQEKENESNLSATAKQKSVDPLSSENIKVEAPSINESEINENEANGSDDDGPEEVKIVKTNVENHTELSVNKNKEKPVYVQKTNPLKTEQKPNFKIKRKIPSTLLQKLLYKEIRHERNIVLQCIRYIKRNNYFESPQQ